MTEEPRVIKLGYSQQDLLLIAIGFSFYLASWLVANVGIGESVSWVSALFIVILALPSYYFLLRWLPWRKGVGLLLVFSILPLIVESVGISTGLPYGDFYYSDELGFKVFGLVPWSVSFAFAPLVLGTMATASQFTSDVRILLPFSALLLVIFDLVLDPAMVALGVWVWIEPGPYYGIPITNYLGWFLTALIASGLMYLIAKAEISTVPRINFRIASSLLLTLFFWTGYSVWTSLWIPVAVGGIMIVLLLFLLERKYDYGGCADRFTKSC